MIDVDELATRLRRLEDERDISRLIAVCESLVLLRKGLAGVPAAVPDAGDVSGSRDGER
ncbi:hypothetical protein [Mycobacterium sp. 852002-51057_SCH5723018]|uniref:hypothetical protein n=1 Tax=Mycobacterium sp. 852002-51057_SCH5723018 TaxID=1834094 RepID=UPI000AF0304E|nr:hypothetical protein [Mycobacterium sp. 852002-51057_SCH5723018]